MGRKFDFKLTTKIYDPHAGQVPGLVVVQPGGVQDVPTAAADHPGHDPHAG